MNKNVTLKLAFIVVLTAVAAWTLYPPSKTLKRGIDLAGGTSLIYEIDTHGLSESDKRDLAQKMITVLRRRIDPANIQNLIWRPQGNNRFEIQLPLASEEAHEKRVIYETAEKKLLDKNVSRSRIMRSLDRPAAERTELFNTFAKDDPNRLAILENLAATYDKRKELQSKRDTLYTEIENTESKINSAGLGADNVKRLVNNWITLNNEQLTKTIAQFTDVNENRELLTGYVKAYAQWTQVANQLPEINSEYRQARKTIDELNLSKDQLDVCLEKKEKSSERKQAIEKLKEDFPDRAAEIDAVVAAYDQYSPYKGRLDDPKDLQRMLKGAGILEFRILPTRGHPEVNMDEIAGYIESLKEKGPNYSSDNKYVWCEIENTAEWLVTDSAGRTVTRIMDGENRPAIVESFGDKYYVLACNSTNECMLHGSGEKEWKLDRAYPTTDDMGRRAIGFILNDRGGFLFSNITGKNIERPLCILLDGIAISAPNISQKIGKQGIIRGSFTQTEVEDMVNKLNAGSLPARLIEQPISVNTIGPSIGADNRDQGIRSGIIGLIAVVVCMAIYYTLAGSIADIALLLNLLFTLAIMAGLRATFTLPGIAGMILTIGMSVDANVLVFERIREEQLRGSSLRIAIANGYQRAFRTIFDSNLTTFITAAILYWRASEEVKGFAIVLMLGIASSMFTALFVTRVIFDLLLNKRIIKDHLVMLRLIHNPNINWMRSRPVFFTISSVLIIGGLLVFFTRDDVKDNKYDIEFTGGTSVQINLKKPMSRQEVEDKINLNLPAANVYSIGTTGKQYEINTTETNKIIVTVTFPQADQHTTADLTNAINKAQKQFASGLNNLIVSQDGGNSAKFTITTSQMNQSLVKDILSSAFPDAEISQPQVDEIVNNAILNVFADQLEIQQNLRPTITSVEKITEELTDSHPELTDYIGGVMIECTTERAATIGEIEQRFKDLLFKPDTRNLNWYTYELLDSRLNPIADPNQSVKSFVYVSAETEAGIRELTEDEWNQFVDNEKSKVLAATMLETSLPRVRQFDPSVGSEQKTRAIIAIILSLFAIVTYIWIRFGNVRYGIAAIIALIHDVCITLGAVTACTYIAASPIGEKLLIGDFKINLAMIAAFLTLIGYSLNDTIVVFDRIRENRGKNRQLNPQIITDSINQTISRTIMTSFTTFIVIFIMYIFGGPGLRGFNFAIGFGVIIGTYSSIAIAAPILLLGNKSQDIKSKK